MKVCERRHGEELVRLQLVEGWWAKWLMSVFQSDTVPLEDLDEASACVLTVLHHQIRRSGDSWTNNHRD